MRWSFGRRWPVHGLLLASVALNVGMVAYLASTGGLRRVLVRLNLVDVSGSRAAFMEADEARFRKLPNTPGKVTFAGDSLIAAGPWAEFYSPIRVRGIGGETTSGLLGRLDEVTEDRPRRLILLVGANDLAAASPPGRVVANYRTILERVRAESPGTSTVVVGVPPMNPGFANPPNYTNAEVLEVNRRLRDLVAEFPGARFVDVSDLLADEAGNLRPEFTNDGLHLTVEGYLALRRRIGEVVEPAEPGRTTEEAPQP